MLVGALAVLGAGAAPADAQTKLDRDREIRLAMSAGPPAISRDADVWVFGPRGFEKAIEGSNGYGCMVIRSANDPELLAPHCFSPDAVETVVPGKLAEARLIAEGKSGEEVEATLLAAFDDGTLPLPSGDAHAYMMSSGQRLGAAGQWKPHFMIYRPFATNDGLAGSIDDPRFPFVGPEIGHPHSTMVIVMTDFVDPEEIVLPSGR